MLKYFKSEKFKRWWCRWRHSASRTGKFNPNSGLKNYRCDKCKLEWKHLPEQFIPR